MALERGRKGVVALALHGNKYAVEWGFYNGGVIDACSLWCTASCCDDARQGHSDNSRPAQSQQLISRLIEELANCLRVEHASHTIDKQHHHRPAHTTPPPNPRIPSPPLLPQRRNPAAVNRSAKGPRHEIYQAVNQVLRNRPKPIPNQPTLPTQRKLDSSQSFH